MANNNSSFLDRFIKPSTRSFASERRQVPGYALYDWLHGYIYGRWPYLYIGIGTGEHPIAKVYLKLAGWFRGYSSAPQTEPTPTPPDAVPSADTPSNTFADGYHGKVVPLEAAKQLVMVNEPVRLQNLEKIIPYPRARDIVLQNPDHIVALECPCRTNRESPCLPLDVCLIVGEPFASFVSEHHPNRSRWITSAEAVAILKAEDERGHVHHAFFKDAMLGRFYAICNCCACCCGAMHAHHNGTPMLASSGYVCSVDETLCIGCGDCESSCQFNALTLNIALGLTEVDNQACMGCGVCVDVCLQEALSLQREPARGEPLELLKLIEQSAAA